MRAVVFATCDQQPLFAPDDLPLVDALRGRGVAVDPVPWTQIDPFAILDAPPILLRSTWDYHRMPTMFRVWLQGLAACGRMTWNEPTVALQNIDKTYLRDLEAKGIALPRTVWLDHVDPAAIQTALNALGSSRAVLKPRIAATAYGTFLIDEDTVLSDDDLGPARASGALVQELIPEVTTSGEISLVYIDGGFSHAMRKRAAEGEFRVQKDFGGRVTSIDATPEQLAFADRVLAANEQPYLYARVDIVDTASGPRLMELELIEPELYFLHAPEGAHRLADALVARLDLNGPA